MTNTAVAADAGSDEAALWPILTPGDKTLDDVETEETEETEDDEKPVDPKVIERLNAENKKWREKYQAEKARATALEAEAGKGATAEERLAAAEARAAEAEAAVLRVSIALEHGLTKEDASILDGLTDEDKMNQIAARMAATYDKGKAAPRAVGPKGSTNGSRSGSGEDPDALARAFFGIK